MYASYNLFSSPLVHTPRLIKANRHIARKNKGVLQEASTLLQNTYKNTKKEILISVNLAVIVILVLHIAIRLFSANQVFYSVVDAVILPIVFVVHIASFYIHLRLLRGTLHNLEWLSPVLAWASVVILQLLVVFSLHFSLNTAHSFLLNFTLAIVLIYITGTVLNRSASLIWFIVCLLNTFVAFQNRGTAFEYHLMTIQEVQEMKQSLEKLPTNPKEKARYDRAKAHQEGVKQEKLQPYPITDYMYVGVIFFLLAFLPMFFQASFIGQILKTIPEAIQKIELAEDEKTLLKKENVRMSMELDIAKHIQQMVLPREEEFTAFEGLEIGARMDTATEVGGNFYEVLPQKDGSIYFGIGDVTEHGLNSGVVMLMTQAAFRATLDNSDIDIVTALNQINSILRQNISRMKDQRDLTLSLLHYKNGTVAMTGQHETVILLRKKEDFAEQIDNMDLSLYIGLIDDFSDNVQESNFDMEIGDIMLLYTDGASGALNREQREFGIQGLMQSLERHRAHSSQQIVSNIIDEIYDYMGSSEPLDDITIVIVKRTE